MIETTTRSFVITTELKVLLEQWAIEEDRSVSYVVRQILKEEAQRRKQALTHQKQSKQRNAP